MSDEAVDESEVWKTIELERPIEAKGGRLTKIKLREPTMADINVVGQPFSLINEEDGGVAMQPIAKKMMRMIARIAPISFAEAQALHPADYFTISNEVMSFFLPTAESK